MIHLGLFLACAACLQFERPFRLTDAMGNLERLPFGCFHRYQDRVQTISALLVCISVDGNALRVFSLPRLFPLDCNGCKFPLVPLLGQQ